MDAADVGAQARVAHVVAGADTASAVGSGSLAVLATPRLLAWCEEATCRAVAASLPAGSTTVGTSVRLDHLAPSAVGARVTVLARVAAVEGRRVVLAVEARDAGGALVARGTVERVVVDEQRFLARLGRARAEPHGGPDPGDGAG